MRVARGLRERREECSDRKEPKGRLQVLRKTDQ